MSIEGLEIVSEYAESDPFIHLNISQARPDDDELNVLSKKFQEKNKHPGVTPILKPREDIEILPPGSELVKPG